MSKTTTLPDYTATYGIDATETDAVLIVTKSTKTAHIAANANYYGNASGYDWTYEAVTACDRYFPRTEPPQKMVQWWRAGTYEPIEVAYVLTADPRDMDGGRSFERICQRCRKVAANLGLVDLMSDVAE